MIFDRQYTPALFDTRHHRYVPAEAVYAVFECKPTFNKGYLEYAADKAASVRRLKRTSVPIVHSDGVKPPKELFRILGGLLAADVEWSDGLGTSFSRTMSELTGDRVLDCGFAAAGYVFAAGSLGSTSSTSSAAAHFVFRLLHQLQSLGTVPAVDWSAYASAVGGQLV